MKEKIYLYADQDHLEAAQALRDYLNSSSIEYSFVEVKAGSPEAGEVASWSDGIETPLPLVRIGEKIRINLFNPNTALLARLFPEGGPGEGDVSPAESLTMFTTSWCPDCWRMEMFLKTKGIAVERVNADKEPNALPNIMKWSGGRRTVPSFQWAGKARMFHPGTHLAGLLLTPSAKELA